MIFDDLTRYYDQWVSLTKGKDRFLGVRVTKDDMDEIADIIERGKGCRTKLDRQELLKSLREVRHSDAVCEVMKRFNIYFEPFHVSRKFDI